MTPAPNLPGSMQYLPGVFNGPTPTTVYKIKVARSSVRNDLIMYYLTALLTQTQLWLASACPFPIVANVNAIYWWNSPNPAMNNEFEVIIHCISIISL